MGSLLNSFHNYTDSLIQFVEGLTTLEFFYYFWPFLVFDFTRYVLLDVLIPLVYIPHKMLTKSKKEAARSRLYKENPLVSVLVPGKNEGKHIPRLAASLQEQSYKNFELIIVDDGSDDETEIICRILERQKKIDKFIRNDIRGGKAAAANTALYFSKGKYIVHIDADSHLDNNSIETILIPFYENENVGAVGGDVRVTNLFSSMATRLQAIEYAKSISSGRTIASMLGLLRIISGAHGAFRRDVLQRVQGWDVGPGLDGDITLKMRKLGYKVVHEPEAVCYTNVPIKFSKLAKQRFRWDRSMVRFRMRKHLDILLPTLSSFKLSNIVTTTDNLFFNFILNFKWWFYISQLIFMGKNQEFLVFIFSINYLFYFVSNIFEYSMACLIFGKTFQRKYFILFLYLPLIPFYTGFFLRIIRSYAYIMEIFFKVSYDDGWNPWKVSQIAKKEGL